MPEDAYTFFVLSRLAAHIVPTMEEPTGEVEALPDTLVAHVL